MGAGDEEAADEQYGPKFAKYRNDADGAQADPEAMGMGKRLFQTYCMQAATPGRRGKWRASNPD